MTYPGIRVATPVVFYHYFHQTLACTRATQDQTHIDAACFAIIYILLPRGLGQEERVESGRAGVVSVDDCKLYTRDTASFTLGWCVDISRMCMLIFRFAVCFFLNDGRKGDIGNDAKGRGKYNVRRGSTGRCIGQWLQCKDKRHTLTVCDQFRWTCCC